MGGKKHIANCKISSNAFVLVLFKPYKPNKKVIKDPQATLVLDYSHNIIKFTTHVPSTFYNFFLTQR